MKKYIYSFCAVAIASLALSSCKKDYLNTAPTDQYNKDVVFSTTANAYGVLNGIYRLMYSQYSNQNEGGESSVMIDADLLGEDLVFPTTGNNWFVDSYQWLMHRTVNSSQDYFVYRYYYRLIGNTNQILENIDAATGPDADKKAIKGEALAIRAFCHFKLVQLYGKRYVAGGNNTQLGVPLVATTSVEPQPRATVEDVYKQINADLDAAITNLTGASARTTKSHINLNVAQGLKARVALTQQDYATAAAYAALARTGLSLMSNADYMAGFNNLSNTEWMWGITQISDQTTYFYSFFAYMSVNFNSTNIRSNPKCINSALYERISATDVRKKLWDPTGTDATFPVPPNGSRFPYMNRKFLANSAANSYGDLTFMRAGEMYLIEAESNARQGKDVLAQDALYTLAKNRDASYVKSTNTGAALIDEIMTQRRVELWGEGFRFFDLKRLDLALNRNGANHVTTVAKVLEIPKGDPQWEWLIPQNEITSNPKIVQNP
ncbi:RagB/SusD family nutrient uptake outer membrane protein [Mucilaginibacter sp. Bleaf8]|uniref:RagB/SusD family nutrient uptake outer membrane protein n=1 Tax=Mucilaginibacter sp. Bleaf8 TaxID=2834430 RepID=UPI001BCDF485|nr:RagB/SusD family nutrient uptake outer membrane protein [Mucilaginibacter sp. Bleaf8]MBS7564447.1 RagB/SusD family nutrient uptake outer membrane protein [Mucilaginibacter sp. Bleaf8]